MHNGVRADKRRPVKTKTVQEWPPERTYRAPVLNPPVLERERERQQAQQEQ